MKIAQFVLFISLFIGIYGGFHVYAYHKLKFFFPSHLWLLITILALLGCSIILVEVLSHGGVKTPILTALAYITFSWMGVVFLFFAISVPVDRWPVSWERPVHSHSMRRLISHFG